METPVHIVQYKINGTDYFLQFPETETKLIQLLSENDEYTVQYLESLIINEEIILEEDVYEIKRIQNDIEEVIYLNNNEVTETKEKLTRGVTLWGDNETRFLLEKYELYIPQVGPRKRFHTKKHMWAEIAVNINNHWSWTITGLQCENRYKTVLKRKKEAVENNSKSGHSRVTIPFEEELSKIAMQDDSIQPEVLRSASNVRHLKPRIVTPSPGSGESSSGSHVKENTKKRKRAKKSAEELLLELHEKKEAAKERRHKEKLDLIRELLRK